MYEVNIYEQCDIFHNIAILIRSLIVIYALRAKGNGEIIPGSIVINALRAKGKGEIIPGSIVIDALRAKEDKA